MSRLQNKKDLIFFSEQISKNISLWHEHKQNYMTQAYLSMIHIINKEFILHTNNLSKEEISY